MKHSIIAWIIIITPFIGLLYYKQPMKITRGYETFRLD